ncbi:DUF3006 domain-containing protein [Paenibacillus residui]|uniref:DUF3006 domain-containing protein n=1 Tax=Paenibacillus residui TaxID=629724 RepID=A0ABW3D6Z1_9BACL
MKGIVDRFEGNYVVIEVDGQTKDVPRNEVDPDVKDGDVVILVDGLWRKDPQGTKERMEQIKKLMEDVWED